MIRIPAFLIAALTAIPAAAQTYQSNCQTIRYGKDDVRTVCTDTYTPAPKPWVPQTVNRGHGWSQDVVYAKPTAIPAEEKHATPNHCGVGYVYKAATGCELAR